MKKRILSFVLALVVMAGLVPNGVNTVFANQTFEITAIAMPGGSVTGDGTFAYGERVNLRATPAPGFSFAGWFLVGVGLQVNEIIFDELFNKPRNINANYTFYATENIVLRAEFHIIAPNADPNARFLDMSVSPSRLHSSRGRVIGGGLRFVREGHYVKVIAQPNLGYTFVGWQLAGHRGYFSTEKELIFSPSSHAHAQTGVFFAFFELNDADAPQPIPVLTPVPQTPILQQMSAQGR